jgi:hypothetical protein
MAAATITFTPFEGAVSVTQINTLFSDIAAVLNGKLDAEDDTASDNLDLGANRVINVPYATDLTSPVPLKQFNDLTGG